jgi:WD40 repeat protein
MLVEPFVISGSEDNTVRVWSLRTGECIRVLEARLKTSLDREGKRMRDKDGLFIRVC